MDNQMNQYDNGNGYPNGRGGGHGNGPGGQGGNNGNGQGGDNRSPWRGSWIYYVMAGLVALVIFFMFSNISN